MLVHFPVALWPAHWLFHVFSEWLPPGVGALAAFWLLTGGCVAGWLGAIAGLTDLVGLSREPDRSRLTLGLVHGGINGVALLGFSTLAIFEYAAYPQIVHGTGMLVGEAAMLAALFLGNYFGGAIVWRGRASP